MLECTPPPRTHVHTHTHERAAHTHTENKPVLCSNSSPISGFPQGYRYKQEETGRHSFPWLVGWAGLLADAILDYAGRWPLTCLSACVDICFHFKSCGPFLLKFIVFVLFYLEIVGALMCVTFQVFREQPVQEAENSLYHCPLRGLRPIG